MPYTSKQNGIDERRNMTLVGMVRSMMGHANLSLDFWREAVFTAYYILNWTPTKAVPLTPHKIFTGRTLSLDHLRV
ncbi:hypothetical protein AMTRI_Chr10g232310 [Amborella trichopoda]